MPRVARKWRPPPPRLKDLRRAIVPGAAAERRCGVAGLSANAILSRVTGTRRHRGPALVAGSLCSGRHQKSQHPKVRAQPSADRKLFFFEKKNQKTFASWCTRRG
jgi:hypothetical protein